MFALPALWLVGSRSVNYEEVIKRSVQPIGLCYTLTPALFWNIQCLLYTPVTLGGAYKILLFC